MTSGGERPTEQGVRSILLVSLLGCGTDRVPALFDAPPPGTPQVTLTAASSYAELVGVASRQCPTNQLVAANAPSESYLVIKMQGSGSCFKGTRMPKPPESVSAAELQLVRDWIANGAPRN